MEEKSLKFYKMQGAGNDYIYINCLASSVENPESLAVKLSDRHFGIGGDGLVLILPSSVADAKMRMFNADGSEGKMCGNAIRCVGKLLHDELGFDKNELTVETLSGIKTLRLFLTDENAVETVTVNMGKAILSPEKIPVLLSGESVINRRVKISESIGEATITCVSTGNPHCVTFDYDPDTLNIEKIGIEFEFSPLFPERVNTEFIKVLSPKELKMRVWERGSGETLACGTGACAAVVAATECGFCPRGEEIKVKLKGGELFIRYEKDGTIMLRGGATLVFVGEIKI